MSSTHIRAHYQCAERNYELSHSLVDEYPDWAAVVAFYAALHLIEAYAIAQHQQIGSHSQRIGWIRQNKELRTIGQQYSTLQRYSEIARYDAPTAEHWLRDPNTVKTRVFPLLSQVVACAKRELRKVTGCLGESTVP